MVRPSQAVTITANSARPEGDTITYEWDGRDAETTTYGYGKHLVKCRAVDSFGAASPWSAIVFFVADDVGGGMTLTTANSYVEESGISFEDNGETIYGYITEYTLTFPPSAVTAAATTAGSRRTTSSPAPGTRSPIRLRIMA